MKIVPSGVEGMPLEGIHGRDCVVCDEFRKAARYLRCPACGRLLSMTDTPVSDRVDDLVKAFNIAIEKVRENIQSFGESVTNATPRQTPVDPINHPWPADDAGFGVTLPNGGYKTYGSVYEMAADIQRLEALVDDMDDHLDRIRHMVDNSSARIAT